MKKVMKKSLCALLALAMVCTGLVLPGTEARAEDNVSYIDESGAEKTQDGVTAVTDALTEWSEGWYVVNGTVNVTDRITVTGDVNLILADGCTLTASQGISVNAGNSLTIYAQSDGSSMGKLVAKGGASSTYTSYGLAAIGGNTSGNDDPSAGTIIINGGDITATADQTLTYGAAGIGGGAAEGGCGNITINGGKVTATGGKGGAGIGVGGVGFGYAPNCSITINGGTIVATGYDKGPGIGGNNGSITITGGNITANATMTGTDYASVGAGIGSAGTWAGDVLNITISGGLIHAQEDVTQGNGIGGSNNSSYNNGTVNFYTGKNGNAVIYSRGDLPNGTDTNNISCVYYRVGVVGNKVVYGSPAPTSDFEVVKSGDTLTVPEGAVLIIPDGVTLTNNGTIENNGHVIIEGSGKITGSGSITKAAETGPAYGVSVDEITFTGITYGDERPEAKTITIKNIGVLATTIKSVALSGTNAGSFTLTGSGTAELAKRNDTNTSWKIQPNDKLGVGTYNATVTVTYTGRNGAVLTAEKNVSLTVGQATATVTKPEGKSLTYNGKDQALVTEGSVTPDGAGTMKYSSTGSDYTDQIPTGKAADTYTVYWKIEGADTENYDYGGETSGTVTVNIGQSEADVTPTKDTISYDYGTDGGITLEVTVAPKNKEGIALTSAGVNQVEFDFPKGDNKTVDLPTGEGTATVKIEANEVKNYFNQGENTVNVSYGGSGNLNEGSTTINVTVKKKQLEFTFTPDTRAYEEGNTSVTGELNSVTEAGVLSGDTVTAEYTANMDDANAGDGKTVNVTVTLEGADADYYEAVNPEGVTVNISKADASVTEKPVGQNITYDGSDHELVTAGEAEGGELKYSLTNGDDYSNAIPTGSAAQEYTVYYKVVGDSNHNDTEAQSVTATISKAASEVTKAPTANKLTYTGSEQELVTKGEATGGTLKYALGDTQPGEESFTETIPAETNAGTYYVWYKVVGDKDHENTTPAKVDVTIAQATSSVTVSASENPTYGNEITLTAEVSAGGIGKDKLGGTVQFKVGGDNLGEAVSVDTSSGKATLTIGGNDTEKQHALFGTGSNTQVTAVYSGNDNIEKSTSEAKSVTVKPKELTFEFNAKGKTYDNDTAVNGEFEALTGQLLPGDDVSVKTYTANTNDPNVGTEKAVTVEVTELGGDAAKYYTPGAATSNTINITKADTTDVVVPTGRSDLVYNGAEQALIQAEGSATGGTMKYYVGEKNVSNKPDGEIEWKGAADIKAKDAGTYTVWYYVEGDGNHNNTEAQSITVEIAQKEVTLEWSGDTGLTYTGSAHTISATVSNKEGDDEVNVTVEVKANGGETGVSGATATNAGSYTATATGLTGSAAKNYKLPSEKTKEFTIAKAPVSFTVTGNEVTYDTKTHTATVTQKDSESPKLGDGDFSVTYGDDNASSETNAGEYTIHVQLSNNNFKFDDLPDETREKTLTEKLTIKQAELTLEVSGSEITYGQTLSASNLTGKATIGEGTEISGEWAWDATDGAKYPTVKTDSGETEYTVKFTPTSGAENFVDTSKSTTITITVNPYTLTPVVDTVEGKTYDGTVTVPDSPTLKFEENLDIAPFNTNKPSATGSFEFVDKNVGESKHVNVKDITLSANPENYQLNVTSITDAETTAAITAKTVTLTWKDYENLGYDKNAKNVTATTEDFVADDDVSLSYKDNDKVNAGTYTATAELAGTDAGNYTISNNTQEYKITPAPVSFTIGEEVKVDWSSNETNGDPNPEGYKLTGEGTDYVLEMVYDSFYHTVEVKRTEGEAVTIEKKAENGYCVTYKRVKDAEGKDVTEAAIEAVRNAGTYEIYVTINPVSSEGVRNYVFEGHEGDTELKIGEITVKPYEITVAWTHLSYVYHGHPMHPNITVLNAFKNDLYTGTSLPTDFDPDTYNGNRVIAFGATGGSDVGEYTVTAKLYGANAGNYTVTDPDETVNIVPAPVTFTVGDNIWVIDNGTVDRTSVTLRPTWGAVTTDPDTAVHDSYPKPGTAVKSELETTIVYKKDGVEYTAPTEAGTYEVWVTIGNKNFRHSATSDGASHNVGELIITTDRNSVRSYTVTFDPDYEGATGPEAMTGVFANQTVVMPAIGFEREGHIFQGWSYGGRVYMPNEEFHMPSSDVTFKAQWLDTEDIRSVGGTVKQEQKDDPTKSDPVLGATVTLKQGSNEIGETVTDVEGKFNFENLVPGIYNLEVRYHNGDVEVVKTYLVDVEGDSSLEGEYVLPGGALNTVVEADVTAVVDMESIVEEADDEGIYTTEDAETVNEGGSVEFKMTVKGTEATPEQIEEIPVPEERIGMVLDMKLTKTVTDTSGSKTESGIEDTKTPITTVIHLSPELQGKSSYTIYRFHDLGDGNDMQTITTSENENGEYLKVIREGTAIELHARLYSTYVLTWAQRSGGGGSAGLEVELPESVVGGKVSADRPTANPGERVTVTMTASEGFAAGQVHVYTASGAEVEVTVNDDGTYSFTMPNEAVVVTVGFGVDCPKDATCPIWPYTDAAPTQWYHDGVHYVLEKGIMDGYGNNIFKPSATLSRAMVAEMLYKMNGRPAVTGDEPFDDVDVGDWYRDAVIWANANGYITGYGDGTFRPETAITREQLATIMLRYERKHNEVDEELTKRVPSLPDAETTGEWYVEGVNWAVAVGIIGGRNVGGTDLLLPASTATRAEAATMVMRWIEKVSTKA